MGRIRICRHGSFFEDGWLWDCLISDLVPGKIEGEARNVVTKESVHVDLKCPDDFYEQLVGLLEQLDPNVVINPEAKHMTIGLKRNGEELHFDFGAPLGYETDSPYRSVWDLVSSQYTGTPFGGSYRVCEAEGFYQSDGGHPTRDTENHSPPTKNQVKSATPDEESGKDGKPDS